MKTAEFICAWQSLPCVLTFFTGQKIEMIDKSDDEESNLTEVLQRIPIESGRCFPALVLRGMDGKQMNMASEQRTELWGAAVYDMTHWCRIFIARLRWDRPLQRRSAGRHLLRSYPVRDGRREVVTRFISVFLFSRESMKTFFCVLLKTISIKGQG